MSIGQKMPTTALSGASERTARRVEGTVHPLLNISYRVLQHGYRWPRDFDTVPAHRSSSLRMLHADNIGIRIRNVVSTLFDTRNKRGFRCIEPDSDKWHQ